MKQDETFVKSSSRGNNPYARSAGKAPYMGNGNETFVPGMQDNAPGVADIQSNQAKGNTPVVGFLYSISRKGIGEYWPLHLGTNTIGRSSDCDIVLKERSVSEHHATLSIKQMKSTKKLIASIRDVGSKNGMYLNEEELDYDNHTCKLNDIITVGANYKLLLLLIDAEQYGLSVSEDFAATEDDDDASFGAVPGGFAGDDTQGRFNPYNSENRNVDTGTVDLNGGQQNKPGGTKFM